MPGALFLWEQNHVVCQACSAICVEVCTCHARAAEAVGRSSLEGTDALRGMISRRGIFTFNHRGMPETASLRALLRSVLIHPLDPALLGPSPNPTPMARNFCALSIRC